MSILRLFWTDSYISLNKHWNSIQPFLKNKSIMSHNCFLWKAKIIQFVWLLESFSTVTIILWTDRFKYIFKKALELNIFLYRQWLDFNIDNTIQYTISLLILLTSDHIESIHENKKYECDVCSKILSKDSLRKHKAATHKRQEWIWNIVKNS